MRIRPEMNGPKLETIRKNCYGNVKNRCCSKTKEDSETYFFISFKISRAAFAPDPPVNPAPGCVPEPHKYKF